MAGNVMASMDSVRVRVSQGYFPAPYADVSAIDCPSLMAVGSPPLSLRHFPLAGDVVAQGSGCRRSDKSKRGVHEDRTNKIARGDDSQLSGQSAGSFYCHLSTCPLTIFCWVCRLEGKVCGLVPMLKRFSWELRWWLVTLEDIKSINGVIGTNGSSKARRK